MPSLTCWSPSGPVRKIPGNLVRIRPLAPEWRAGLPGRPASPAAARHQPDPLSFETGLPSLTRELSNPDHPQVNYRRRRQALETWSISEDTWPNLAARSSLMALPKSGDRKRQIASVYV